MITVALISILTFAISLPFLPSEIPAHYNYLGEADRYGSKYENLVWPVSICAVELLLWIIGRIPKRHSIA
jgi:uncharacterized membrane protein